MMNDAEVDAQPPSTAGSLRRTQLERLLGRLLITRELVSLQQARVEAGNRKALEGEDREEAGGAQEPALDIELLVLATRQVHQLVGALRAIGVDVGRDEDAIRSSAEVKNARDVLSHLDDYLRGTGNLQRGLPGVPVTMLFRYGPSDVRMSLYNPDLDIDVGAAARDAVALADDAILEGLAEIGRMSAAGERSIQMCLTAHGVVIGPPADSSLDCS